MGRRQMRGIRRCTLLGVVLAILVSAWLAGAAVAATAPATAPAIVGATSNATSLSGVTAVAVSGNYAFAASYWSGQLNVLDITNPASPTLVASTPSATAMTDATNVTIAGGFAFVTSKNRNASTTSNDDGTGNSLTVVDISNPLAPSVVGTVQDSTNLFGAYSVAVSGHYAFVASQGVSTGQPAVPDTSTGRFSVIDLNNLAGGVVAHIDNASLTGALANGLEHATSVSISGNDAYVTAFYGSRLTTIDISNPTSPVPVASIHDQTNFPFPNDVATQGSYAYVVNQISPSPTMLGMELAIVNIANPAAPVVVGSLTDPLLSGAYRIRVRGNLVYISANSASSVAMVDVSNPSSPRLVGSVTDPHLANVTGLDLSATGRYLIAAAPRAASENSPPPSNFPPYPLQAGGPTNTGTVSVIDLEPAPLSVAITPASEPANPTAQTSASFSFGVSDAVVTVQCSLDHAAFGTCTSPTTATYSALGLGAHTFTVQATDSTGATAQATYTWTITTKPHLSAAPKISGTAQQGHKLTVTSGVWSGSPTFRYQWETCNAKGKSCKSISNQVKTTYLVTAAAVGSRLEAVVTATNPLGTATAPSAETKIVTWSASALASATLTGSKTTSPGISLSVPSPGSSLKLRTLVISLPKGISFAATKRALAAGTSVRDLGRKRLSFSIGLSHGRLTLTFKKPPTGLKLTVAHGLVSISSALESRILARKAKSEKVSLTLDYVGKPPRHGAVKFRLS
jgi:hypothetical protein